MTRGKKTPVVIPVGKPTLLDFAAKWSGYTAVDRMNKRRTGYKIGKGYRKTGFKKGGQVKK